MRILKYYHSLQNRNFVSRLSFGCLNYLVIEQILKILKDFKKAQNSTKNQPLLCWRRLYFMRCIYVVSKLRYAKRIIFVALSLCKSHPFSINGDLIFQMVCHSSASFVTVSFTVYRHIKASIMLWKWYLVWYYRREL